MSQQDLWSALGRSRLDLSFSGQLAQDFSGTLQKAGYGLTAEEIELLRQALTAPAPSLARAVPSLAPEDIQFQREKMRERTTAQVERSNELGRYTVNILKETLNNARSAYHKITLMNSVMFATGIGLFIAAAIYGAVSHDRAYSAMLAGLGAANFVALFLFGPIERTQNGLSNLVQVEIAFMNYFEQITFWETYALMPTGDPPAPNLANIREASLQLQKRSEETMALLQNFVENTPSPGLLRTPARNTAANPETG
jgi:hypothetical protein